MAQLLFCGFLASNYNGGLRNIRALSRFIANPTTLRCRPSCSIPLLSVLDFADVLARVRQLRSILLRLFALPFISLEPDELSGAIRSSQCRLAEQSLERFVSKIQAHRFHCMLFIALMTLSHVGRLTTSAFSFLTRRRKQAGFGDVTSRFNFFLFSFSSFLFFFFFFPYNLA